ncbi:MAG TPA: exosome complex RNA-binding protein Csl4 [Thermoplasmata archaeon]|nr:exosome complex RNA-binding protein Csl4 [Thermoplasmata archaeon]
MMEEGAKGLVLPGEFLGTAEEFVPGRGTYEDNGRIYAALLGHRRVDVQDRAVHVDALHAIPHLEEGDEVYARVDEVKSAMVIVTVLSLASGRRGVPGAPEGTIHISKAKAEYTESLNDEFSPGDLVVAEVIQSRPTIKLSTAPPLLGVVSARCQVCHALLEIGPKELSCPRCGHRERRKVARGRGGAIAPPPAERPDGADGPD